MYLSNRLMFTLLSNILLSLTLNVFLCVEGANNDFLAPARRPIFCFGGGGLTEFWVLYIFYTLVSFMISYNGGILAFRIFKPFTMATTQSNEFPILVHVL